MKKIITEEKKYLETFEADDATFKKMTKTDRISFVKACNESLKRKSKQIGLRINEQDLAMLRSDASRQGIPYQTLIGSILHKYTTGQLS